jgi:hypothetical protein
MHWKMRAPKQLLHICKDSIATAIIAEFAKMPNKKEMMVIKLKRKFKKNLILIHRRIINLRQ